MPDKPINQDLINTQYLSTNSEPNLKPYEAIIHNLAPLVNKPSFNAEFERQTHSIAQDLRFLVKMEIKRLAKPCIRSIDLRAVVKDDCRLFNHHGISHYLNVNGILCFEKLVKRYGEYTFGVYELVIDEAEKEKQQYLQSKQNQTHKTEITIAQEPYIVPCQDLLNFPVRKQERLNYVVDVEIFFPDNSSVHASTTDISINGLRIKLKNSDALSKFKEFTPLSVAFRDTKKHFGWSHGAIDYQTLNISNENSKIQLHLYRQSIEGDSFDKFVAQLIKVNKHRYKVNLDNVEMALSSKVYEQAFANTTPSLPVFVSRKNEKEMFAEYASMNANNKNILDYWKDENGQQLIGYLVNQNRIKSLINQADAYPQTTVYCFNHVKDEKVYFYSASKEELALYPLMKSTFLSYAARKASFRVYQLACTDINPIQAYSPTSIPDGVSRDVDDLNKGLSPRLQAKIQYLAHMISVTDITSDTSLACYQKRELDIDLVPQLKAFGHARNKLPHIVEACRHKQQELRKQSRYILRTPVMVETNSQVFYGSSEDISVSGLKIQLDEAFNQRAYSKVKVTFPKLQSLSEHYELTELTYRVVQINIDKQVLHLKAMSDEEENIAEGFFSELISNNLDKLKKVNYDESVTGINMALRNLHCKNTPQFCTYIEKQQQGFLPAMSTVNQVQAKWMEFLHHDHSLTSVNLSWLYQDLLNGESIINQSLKVLKIDPKPIKTEIFIAAPANSKSSSAMCRAKWTHELRNHRDRVKFIKQAAQLGEFLAFSVTINKALSPDIERLEQELLYLSQHAVHKATYFEERMWDIAGSLFLTDITAEVIHRYKLN